MLIHTEEEKRLKLEKEEQRAKNRILRIEAGEKKIADLTQNAAFSRSFQVEVACFFISIYTSFLFLSLSSVFYWK